MIMVWGIVKREREWERGRWYKSIDRRKAGQIEKESENDAIINKDCTKKREGEWCRGERAIER